MWSASENFGTKQQLKKELITELCAVIAFSAIQNNDKIGVIFFSDKIEKYIPPKKGKGHILLIIRELIEFTPQNNKTNIALGLQFFTNVIKKRCTAFVISDLGTGLGHGRGLADEAVGAIGHLQVVVVAQ